MDECQMHHGKLKNPDSKGYIPYDFIYNILEKEKIYRNRKLV